MTRKEKIEKLISEFTIDKITIVNDPTLDLLNRAWWQEYFLSQGRAQQESTSRLENNK